MLEETLASIDSHVATGDAETMHSRVALNLKYPDRAAVLSVFAFSAILLASVGLYGVLRSSWLSAHEKSAPEWQLARIGATLPLWWHGRVAALFSWQGWGSVLRHRSH